jgi:hypothetical protein
MHHDESLPGHRILHFVLHPGQTKWRIAGYTLMVDFVPLPKSLLNQEFGSTGEGTSAITDLILAGCLP